MDIKATCLSGANGCGLPPTAPPSARTDAAHSTSLSPDAGESYLARQMQIQAETMFRRGISQDLVAVEVRGLEAAVRAELYLALAGGAA